MRLSKFAPLLMVAAVIVMACGGSSTPAAASKGKIAVLLPDSQSSSRWEKDDRRFFVQAFQAAGLSDKDYIISNAGGSASTQQTQADAAITNGATVILLVNLDSGSGATIEANAAAKGVKSIDYDRLTLKGAADYYVSFDNVSVGKLQGQGLVKCLTDSNVANPKIAELNGSPTDNNATLFKQGYDSVLQPKYDSKEYTKVADQSVPDWDNQKALTIFEQMITANPKIDGVLAANDGLGNAVVSALKTRKLNGKIPVTGQDATALAELPGDALVHGIEVGGADDVRAVELDEALQLVVQIRLRQHLGLAFLRPGREMHAPPIMRPAPVEQVRPLGRVGDVVALGETVAAEVIGHLDVESALGLGEALELDVEVLAHDRAGALAADEIAALEHLALAGLVVSQRGDAVGALLEAGELGRQPHVDVGVGLGQRQPLLDDLDALALQRVRKARVVRQDGMIEPSDLLPALSIPVVEHGGDDAARLQPLVETDAVIELERGRVIGAGARHLLEDVVLAERLEQADANTLLGQRQRQAEPDRAGTDNDDAVGWGGHLGES